MSRRQLRPRAGQVQELQDQVQQLPTADGESVPVQTQARNQAENPQR